MKEIKEKVEARVLEMAKEKAQKEKRKIFTLKFHYLDNCDLEIQGHATIHTDNDFVKVVRMNLYYEVFKGYEEVYLY